MREEMAGLVVEAVVAGEEDEGGGVRRLLDGLRDHDLHLLDATAVGRFFLGIGAAHFGAHPIMGPVPRVGP
jgi:hypothetical protein